MILSYSNADYAYMGWINFWQKFVNFFWEKDATGLNYLSRIGIAIAIIVIGWLLIRLLGFTLKKAMRIKKGPNIDASAKYILVQIIKTLLWIGIAFAVASILKFDLTGLAGITSAIAVALGLALQDLVGSFFSGLLIINQKAIRTGDYIKVKNAFGECEGTVDRVHFFITYLQNPAGQKIIVPNKNMSSAVITNFSANGVRRLDFDVGIGYNDDVQLAKDTLLGLLEGEQLVLKDKPVTAYVCELGSYSVTVRLRCWTKFTDYWTLYNQLPEKVLLAFKEKGINIPSSTDLQVKNN